MGLHESLSGVGEARGFICGRKDTGPVLERFLMKDLILDIISAWDFKYGGDRLRGRRFSIPLTIRRSYQDCSTLSAWVKSKHINSYPDEYIVLCPLQFMLLDLGLGDLIWINEYGFQNFGSPSTMNLRREFLCENYQVWKVCFIDQYQYLRASSIIYCTPHAEPCPTGHKKRSPAVKRSLYPPFTAGIRYVFTLPLPLPRSPSPSRAPHLSYFPRIKIHLLVDIFIHPPCNREDSTASMDVP